jgi:prepilin-type N-terminal cleavage/methylation domain-containing protein
MLNRRRGERGFTLIEVLIALLILSIFVGAFLGGVGTSAKAVMLEDERVTAESLARSQIEYIKQQSYVVPSNGEAHYARISNVTTGYSIWSETYNGTLVEGLDIVAVSWKDGVKAQLGDGDTSLERVKLTIKHGTKVVWTLEDYKVDR